MIYRNTLSKIFISYISAYTVSTNYVSINQVGILRGMGNKTFNTALEQVTSVAIPNHPQVDTPLQFVVVGSQVGSYIGKNVGTQPANWDGKAKALVGLPSRLPQITSNGAYPVKDATPAAPAAKAVVAGPGNLPL